MSTDTIPRAIEVLRIEVAKLALAPGDVLLVKVPEEMQRPALWKSMNDFLGKTFPDNKVLLSTQDIEFTVIRPGSAAG